MSGLYLRMYPILVCFGKTRKPKWLAFSLEVSIKLGAGGEKGCVQHEHTEGRALTLFDSNVNQTSKFAQDSKVKYIFKYLQSDLHSSARGQYSTYSHTVGVQC